MDDLIKRQYDAIGKVNIPKREEMGLDNQHTDEMLDAFPHCYIGSRTFAEWQEHAKRDDCFNDMAPSDLREILGLAEKMQGCAKYWCDSISEDKRLATRYQDEMREAAALLERYRDQLQHRAEVRPTSKEVNELLKRIYAASEGR